MFLIGLKVKMVSLQNKFIKKVLDGNAKNIKKNETTLIESYSWQKREGILLKELKKNLEAKKVVFEPMSNDDLWSYLKENIPKEVDSFTKLLFDFLKLFKVNSETISNLEQSALKKNDERVMRFLTLFKRIYELYEGHLKKEKKN